MSQPEIPRDQEVTVEAVHGSLECAGRHVVVGHFRGTPISGAEQFLDERLAGRLTARQLLGLYPERVGESEIVDTPRPPDGTGRGYPPGAIVVGLDLPGELTREKLTATVSAALVRYAVRALEAPSEPGPPSPSPQLLEAWAVPVGTSGVGAMSVEACVAGLVDAVAAANEHLHSHVDPATGAGTWDRVRIARLEIIEVLGDKAEQVAHAVLRAENLMLVPTGAHTRLVLLDRLRTGEGRLPASLSASEAAGDWQRVIIRDLGREQGDGLSTEGATLLEFTAIGRRARADRMQVAVDKRAITGLVDVAVRDARPGGHIGNTLYELLLPNDLKSDLARSENLQLIVDENTADYPWEALSARLSGARARQLALRGGVLRQFRETEVRRAETRAPVGDAALVIGNPPLGKAASLPGAAHEGVEVAKALGWSPSGGTGDGGFVVSGLVWADGQEEDDERAALVDSFGDVHGTPGRRVLDALLSRDWRVLHIAAHGHFDAAESSRSGVMIDSETTLTANVFRQLPAVPALVFLNCCHLGRMTDGRQQGAVANRLAASTARELMRCGVEAVVAAGWAVEDEAAVDFASTFYAALLDGAFFGDAVLRSRRAVHERSGSSSTWSAFQCYGDPGFHLRGATAPPPRRPKVVSAAELVRRVATIRVLAGKIGLAGFDDISRREDELHDELDGLSRRLAEKGWDDPRVFYEVGRAYGELGSYDRAVEAYRRAWHHPDSNKAPVKLLEQLGNLETRLAQSRWRQAGDEGCTPGGPEELIAAARGHLQLALRLGDTPERLALLAGFHKKAAAMAEGAQRLDRLREAARHYEAGHRHHVAAGGEPTSYFALNWLQMASMAGAPADPGEAASLLHWFSVSRTSGDAADGFWARATAGNLALTRWVLDGEADLADIERAYRFAFATRSSRRDRDSVVSHLRDLADLRPGAGLADLACQLGGG